MDLNWKPLYQLAAGACIGMLILIPLQMVVFLSSPPPSTVEGFFTLLHTRPFLGLMSLDLFYMVDMVLIALVSLALAAALFRASPIATVIALFLGTISTAVYFVSNTAFEMLVLSHRYAAAESFLERATILGAGEALLAIYQGTAFSVSYVLAGITGLIYAIVMTRSDAFARPIAYIGIGMNLLALVPPTVGPIGLIFAITYLVPFMIWLVLVARRFLQLARAGAREQPQRAAQPLPPALQPQA